MIILPDKNIVRTKVLMPVPKREWIPPSASQLRDQFGNCNKTQFAITGRLNDGFVVWRGVFDDRNDADAFLFSIITGSIRFEKELWRLPTPYWHPDVGENISYSFAVETFLTSPTGTNQTYTRPADWNNNNNSVEVIGGGGRGADNNSSSQTAIGGAGGGAYSKQNNISISSTATYRIGAGAQTAFTNGGDTWFNGADLASSSVGAKGGSGTSGTNQSGKTGGAAASGIGTTKYSGGTGGSAIFGTNNRGGGGGGGAAGPNGAGNNGTNGGTGVGGNGGSGGAGSGGAGGSGAVGSSSTATSGGNGTDLETSPAYGSGGGGGGGSGDGGGSGVYNIGASGGGYGGGGGGAGRVIQFPGGGYASGNGGGGIVKITYSPSSTSTNMPILGL